MDSSPDGWPAQPAPGRPVPLPLRYPPTLLEALGYRGNATHVVVHLTAAPACPHLMDDVDGCGQVDDLGWRVFVRHPYIAAVLSPYLATAPNMRLLIDRSARTVSVMLTSDVPPRSPTKADDRPVTRPARNNFLALDRKPVSACAAHAQAQGAARAALVRWLSDESRRLWTTASRPRAAEND